MAAGGQDAANSGNSRCSKPYFVHGYLPLKYHGAGEAS